MSQTTTLSRPMTGEEYLESIRDARTIYIYGERVKDVTTHPAFRNAARMVARWYNRMHELRKEDEMAGGPENWRWTTLTEDGKGWTHPFFRAPRNAQDLVKARDTIAELQRTVYGWMGRSPDYKAAFTGTLGANASFYEPYSANARRFYSETQAGLVYWNHAIVNPPIDRNRPIEDAADVYVHVERETDKGLIVSGAKVVATGSAFTHINFIAHYGPIPVKDKKFALICAIPMDSQGLKLLSRPSYEFNAAVAGSPFDYPLSSRLDENDAVLVLDKVLVPWENVFVYGDVEKINAFFPLSGFGERFAFQGATRFAVKLDFIAGLLLKAVEATGTKDYRGVQARVGEVLAWRNLFWALTDAMARNPIPWPGAEGYVHPNPAGGIGSYRVFAPECYKRVKEIILQDVASALVYMPSNAADFKNPEIRPLLDRFVRGSNGYNAEERVKLMKLLWDAVGSEFGGRHELYEMNYAGNHENIRMEVLFGALASGGVDELKAFAEKCLDEYDLNGWKTADLINPTDVNVIGKL